MLKTTINYILETTINISNSSNIFVGIGNTLKLSIVLTPFLYIWDKVMSWGVTNQDYILVVLGAILVDWFFGTIKHIFITKDKNGQPTWSWGKNAIGLATKIGLVVAGGFLFEGLSLLTSDADFLVTSLKIITRVVVFLYPGISAWENIYIVSGEKFPPKAWMQRLTKYNETLDIKDLTKNKDNKDGEA